VDERSASGLINGRLPNPAAAPHSGRSTEVQARADAIGAAAVVRVDMPWEDRTLPLRGPGGQSVGQAGQFCLESRLVRPRQSRWSTDHGPPRTTPSKGVFFYLPLGKPQKRAISVAAQTSVATTKSPTCPHDEAPSVRMGKAWARPSTNTLSTRTAPLPSTKSSRVIDPLRSLRAGVDDMP
jgi:hypothetical protein